MSVLCVLVLKGLSRNVWARYYSKQNNCLQGEASLVHSREEVPEHLTLIFAQERLTSLWNRTSCSSYHCSSLVIAPNPNTNFCRGEKHQGKVNSLVELLMKSSYVATGPNIMTGATSLPLPTVHQSKTNTTAILNNTHWWHHSSLMLWLEAFMLPTSYSIFKPSHVSINMVCNEN